MEERDRMGCILFNGLVSARVFFRFVAFFFKFFISIFFANCDELRQVGWPSR